MIARWKALWADWRTWRKTRVTLLDLERREQTVKLLEARAHLEMETVQLLTRAARMNLERAHYAAQEYHSAGAVWQDEIAALNIAVEEDARLVQALLDWCDRHGCKPSSEDMKEMMSK